MSLRLSYFLILIWSYKIRRQLFRGMATPAWLWWGNCHVSCNGTSWDCGCAQFKNSLNIFFFLLVTHTSEAREWYQSLPRSKWTCCRNVSHPFNENETGSVKVNLSGATSIWPLSLCRNSSRVLSVFHSTCGHTTDYFNTRNNQVLFFPLLTELSF